MNSKGVELLAIEEIKTFNKCDGYYCHDIYTHCNFIYFYIPDRLCHNILYTDLLLIRNQ